MVRGAVVSALADEVAARVAAELRAKVRQSGLPLAQLAWRINHGRFREDGTAPRMSPPVLSRMLSGRQNLTLGTIVEVALALGYRVCLDLVELPSWGEPLADTQYGLAA